MISTTNNLSTTQAFNGLQAQIYRPSKDEFQKHHDQYVIFLHGWMGNGKDFAEIAHIFGNHQFTAICIDLPFHASSIECSPLKLLDAVQILKNAIKSFVQSTSKEPAEVVLVGYSLGGRLAFELCKSIEKDFKQTFHLKSVVLISSAFPPESEEEKTNAQQITSKQICSLSQVGDTSDSYANWLRNVWYVKPMWGNLCETPWIDHLIDRKAANFSERQKKQWIQAAKVFQRADMTVPENKLSTPVLYLSGTDDLKYSAMADRISKYFENHEHCAVKEAGHNILCGITCETLHRLTSFTFKHMTASIEPCLFIDLEPTLQTYSIPTNKSFIVGEQEIDKRCGVLITLFNKNKIAGIGDVCPLPGLHEIGIEECKTELEQFSKLLRTKSFCYCIKCCFKSNLLQICSSLTPVVVNGITCALTHFLARWQKRSFQSVVLSLLSKKNQTFELEENSLIHLNGVLPRSATNSNTNTETLQSHYDSFLNNNPFQTLKLKVGTMNNINDEAETIKYAITSVQNSGKKLRLDANRAWTKTQFEQLENLIQTYTTVIEFLEEPMLFTNDLEEYLFKIENDSCIALALDESLKECSIERIRRMASSCNCSAFIIKPAVIGSLQKIGLLHDICRMNNCEVIFSSVYESVVGLCWNTLLTSVLGSRSYAHGLGTYKLLDENLVDFSFEKKCVVEDGTCVDVSKAEKLLNELADESLRTRVTK